MLASLSTFINRIFLYRDLQFRTHAAAFKLQYYEYSPLFSYQLIILLFEDWTNSPSASFKFIISTSFSFVKSIAWLISLYISDSSSFLIYLFGNPVYHGIFLKLSIIYLTIAGSNYISRFKVYYMLILER